MSNEIRKLPMLKNIMAKSDVNIQFAIALGWIPKKTVMRFFDYGETQMRQLERENCLEISKIKARKFYSTKSIINLIEQNKK